jgi:hypothetical protein
MAVGDIFWEKGGDDRSKGLPDAYVGGMETGSSVFRVVGPDEQICQGRRQVLAVFYW